ncbi:MAG TPA: 4Fe-4S double cluster binding domain-containing protein [Clostridia bacterium]|nr:4Fe-4S double cluster binding domain-containing protein [Clostridia bacterium]
MTNLLKQEISITGKRAEIVSINCIKKLRDDIGELCRNSSLNDYAKEIVNNYFDFNLPEAEFEIRSIIVVASPSPIVKVDFSYQFKKYQFMIPPTYIEMTKAHKEIEIYLNSFLNPQGFHALTTPCLPLKLLAARSGISAYGRNNICYINGMGSFFRLQTYYSDIPSKNENWYDLSTMKQCKTCKACLNSCPTNAITTKSHFVNTDRCITHINENDGTVFPAWLEPSAHNCLIGCFKCQACCPINKEYLNNIIEPVQFSEEETLILLENKPFDQLPRALAEKLEALDMKHYYGALVRNLKALLELG